ncbi:MAG: rubrerythrin [Thiocapsa sp.]|jgi:hypothetical protein|nr:rubrerythrin [Thiocapsa sp.]MCG6898127.1 rubrerythrin [Thiocapsa sp.]
MSDRLSQRIESVAELLVHALELEHQSAECYRQLAQALAVHHNHAAAALFGLLADMSDARASAVMARAEGVSLPEIAPWDFKWPAAGSPQIDCDHVEISYLMTPLQALEVCLDKETLGREFYVLVASESPAAGVRVLAAEMAEERRERVELILTWIRGERGVATRVPEDLDPPNLPG